MIEPEFPGVDFSDVDEDWWKDTELWDKATASVIEEGRAAVHQRLDKFMKMTRTKTLVEIFLPKQKQTEC